MKRGPGWPRWLLPAEHHHIAFHPETLCFLHADGPHGSDQVRRGPVYWQSQVSN
jgi:hypothetical protein